MNHVTRRKFLAELGIAVAGTAISGCATLPRLKAHIGLEGFPPVEPAAVQVDPAKLQKALEFIEAEVNAGSVPGAALAATRNGKTFVEHYYGIYHDLDGTDKPFNPNVANPLFSFSKGISATVAVMAHQDGLIDYDVPVSTYIPEFAAGGKESVTLRHLLTHAAGIPSVRGGAAHTEQEWNDFLKVVCDAPIEWPAGSRTAYHGVSAMFVVAEAIRCVSDMEPWDAICRKRLFAPIGAKSLTFGFPSSDFATAIIPDYFTSLDKYGLAGHPAGGCFGTVEDMLRVLNLIVQGGAWNGHVLLQPDARQEMLTVQYASEIAVYVAAGNAPAHEHWGLGWLIRGNGDTCGSAHWFGFGDFKSPTLFGHAGVETVYGVGDPARQLAFVFIMTDRPKNAEESTRLRREVSNLLQDAVICS